jgi:hypothetical protein
MRWGLGEAKKKAGAPVAAGLSKSWFDRNY